MDKTELEKQKDRVREAEALMSIIAHLQHASNVIRDDGILAMQLINGDRIQVKLQPKSNDQAVIQDVDDLRWQNVCWTTGEEFQDFWPSLHQFLASYLDAKLRAKNNALAVV